MSDEMKKDGGKVRMDLLPVYPLQEVAKVLTFGATKYAPNRWRKGMEWSRLYGAVLRHIFAWFRGQDTDPETGLSHLAHAICGLMFLLEYSRTGAGTDDREGKLKDAADEAPAALVAEDGGVYRQKGGTTVFLFSDPAEKDRKQRKIWDTFGSHVQYERVTSFDGAVAKYSRNGEYDLVEKLGKV